MSAWEHAIGQDAFRIPFSLAAGAIVGSFLNVVIHRLPRRESLVRPGSRCVSCGAPVRWWANVPILSYLALRGRCASCRAPIGVRYPVIEAATAALFFAACIRYGLDLTLVLRDWPMLAMFVAVAAIDLEHRIIPDRLNLFGAGVALATCMIDRQIAWTDALLGGVVGFALFYGFAWLYHSVTGRSGLGGGDIKFLGVAGLFLGASGVFWTIFLSSIAGSVIGVALALLSGRRDGEDGSVLRVAIPYGPFLVLGAVFYYFLRGHLEWLRFTTPT